MLLPLLLVAPPGVEGQEDEAGQETEAGEQEEPQDPCLMCHGTQAMFTGQDDPDRYVVTPEALEGSVHEGLGLSCSSCHPNMEYPHPEDPQPSCSPCHSGIETTFAESLHGYALAQGNEQAPDCATCHGKHLILPSSDPRAATHKVRLPNTCAECHGEGGLLTDEYVKLPQSFQQYARSVHGEGTSRGVAAAASCADCHSVHNLKGSADPESRINPINVATTCGQCHPDIQLEYNRSIHGRALQAGVTDSPTCTDCHGEHLILSPQDPSAKVSGANQAIETCGGCHNDPAIISKFGLQEGVVETYLDSYHGWATRGGGQAATCIDCHNAHLVLPEEDPASSVSSENIVATCGRCHEGSNPTFAETYDHVTASMAGNPVNRFIRDIYLWLIFILIGGMVVHNLVIMNYYMMKRRKEHASDGVAITRFTRNEVIQHLALTVSFLILVVTGFALRFPDAFWVEWLSALGMTETRRGDTHRVAGVVLILTSLYHAYYVLVTKRGRQELKALLPSGKDVGDVWDNLRYFTFRSDRKAKFGRYDYTQKAEYWALVWGTIVMAITGLILWFPELATRFLPALAIPASGTIHYYEAWLATLAILVWHFFFVIFHPEEYPMSWTWLTGKMSKKFVKEHHTEWYEEEIKPQEGETEEAGVPGD
jgi:formate dehydrogenase gamma subunit